MRYISPNISNINSLSGLVSFLLMYLLPLGIWAQTNPENIKISYRQSSLKAKEGELLEDLFIQNPSSLSDHSGIIFQQKEQYYYEKGLQQEKKLRLLVLQVNTDGWQYEQTFFYDKTGELLLFSEKQNHSEVEYQQLEIIFEKDKILQLSQDNIVIKSSNVKFSDKVKEAQQTAIRHLNKFNEYQAQLSRYPFEK